MPEEVDVQPESSPGQGEQPASPPASDDPLQAAIDSGNYAEYERLSNARDVGKEPAPKPAPKSAAPPPKAEAEPAPASQPVKPQEPKTQGRPPKPHAIPERIKELLAENSALRKQLEGAAPGVTPAPPPAPAPQPSPPAPAAAAPKPETPKDDPEPILEKKPDGSRWKDYDEYREAWKGWAFREGGRQREATLAQERQQAAEAQIWALWNSRKEVVAKDPEYPDYEKVAFNKNVFVNKVTQGFLYTSKHGPKILYHLGKNPDFAAKLAQQDAYNTMRALVQLEAAFVEKPEASKPAPPAPTKTRTRMPPPPSDLSGRNAPAPDEVDAAVARGDYRSYERLANEQDLRNAGIRR